MMLIGADENHGPVFIVYLGREVMAVVQISRDADIEDINHFLNGSRGPGTAENDGIVITGIQGFSDQRP